jgi:hypothetical protein
MSDTVATVVPSAASSREQLRSVQQYAARLQAAFVQALTEADVRAIAAKLIEQARDGDRTSARLVLKYGFCQLLTHGKPDWHLGTEAANATKVVKPASPAAAAPTAEQVMAAIHAKVREQQALEAEILGKNRAGVVPGAPPAGGAGRGHPPAAQGR